MYKNNKISINPFFKKNDTAIVFESSDFFIPYLSVALKSLVETSSKNNYYDIIILSNEIDNYNRNELKKICDKENIHIRFFDPTNIVKKYISVSKYHYLNLNYYRLSLPWILKEYKYALNLGADIIIEKDIYILIENKLLSNNYIGGVIDLGYHGRLSMDIPKEELNKVDPYTYINADVLMFNLEKIRNNFTQDEVMNFWQQKQLRCAEQDAFNTIFDGHVQLFPLNWNVFPDRMSSTEHILNAPKDSVKLWREALHNPYIIHYAAFPKPWDYPLIGYGFRWWEYARQSPYYEEILRRMCMLAARSDRKPILPRRIIDKICPHGTYRRELIKSIFPKDSFIRKNAKKIYYFIFEN